MREDLIPPRKPPGSLRRRDVEEPGWVRTLMTLRWPACIVVGLFAAFQQDTILWIVAGGLWVGWGQVVYAIHKRKDPYTAEVVFYSSEDGYNSSGDGDGGGDGD